MWFAENILKRLSLSSQKKPAPETDGIHDRYVKSVNIFICLPLSFIIDRTFMEDIYSDI